MFETQESNDDTDKKIDLIWGLYNLDVNDVIDKYFNLRRCSQHSSLTDEWSNLAAKDWKQGYSPELENDEVDLIAAFEKRT